MKDIGRRRVIVMTGGNRGLGKKTIELLLKSPFRQMLSVVLTGRSLDDVKDAQNDILSQLSLKEQQQCEIISMQLDISLKQSIDCFKTALTDKFQQIDVLCNNAGYVNKDLEDYSLVKKPDCDNIRKTLDINFFGTLGITQALFPMLSSDAKVLQISSDLGCLQFQPEKARQFLQNPSLTHEQLVEAAEKYITHAPFDDEGLFCNSSYHSSKALLNAYVRFVAPKVMGLNQSMYAINPGWVKTRMGGEMAPETLDEAVPYLCDLVTQLPFGRNELSFQFLYRMKSFPF